MTAIITLKQLTDARACSEQVKRFEATFGDSVNVTVAKARKVAGKFDWNFAVLFLDDEGSAAYKAAMAAADAAYKAARAPAAAAYDAAMAAAWASAYIATCKRAKVAA